MTVMREVISVHLGETGIGTGLAFWDCLELEQGGEDTSRDTRGREDTSREDTSRDTRGREDTSGVFFHKMEDGRQVARAVFGDLDPQSLGARRMAGGRWIILGAWAWVHTILSPSSLPPPPAGGCQGACAAGGRTAPVTM